MDRNQSRSRRNWERTLSASADDIAADGRGVSPRSDHAECAVLGCLLLDSSCFVVVAKFVSDPIDFFDCNRQTIFRAMLQLRHDGVPFDTVTLAEELNRAGKFNEVGGVEAFAKLMEAVPNTANADHYARLVAECSARRRRIALLSEAWDAEIHERDIDTISPTVAAVLESCGLVTRANGVRSTAVVRRLSDIEAQPLAWLWPGRIPLGKLTLLAGDPGLGKSFLTCDIAARISKGTDWPDGSAGGEAGSVIMLNCEDDAADTIRPRLDAAGADLSRVFVLDGIDEPPHKVGKTTRRSFSLERDIPTLEALLQQHSDCRLIVVDPISGYCGRTDSHNNTEVRGLLAPLSELAARHRVAVVAVTHLSKGAGGKAVYRAMGSLAFAAAARAVWVVVKDADDDERRLLVPGKTNLGRKPTGLAFRVESNPQGDGVLRWDAEPVLIDADELLRQETEREPAGNRTERDEAKEWLTDVLSAGSVAANEVKDAAKSNGITSATLRRAADELGVVHKREGFGRGSRMVWMLPDHCCSPKPIVAHPQSVSTNGDGEHLCPDSDRDD